MTTTSAVVLRSGPRPASTDRPSPMSRWGLASRLARREVRRRPGRTLMVMMLVAIPVFAMAVLSVMYRTTRDSPEERYQRLHGASDVAVDGFVKGEPGIGPETADLLAVLPVGSRLIEVHTAYAPIRPAGVVASTRVRFTDLPLTDPLTAGIVEVQRGRGPAAPGETLLSSGVAHKFGVDIGDALELANPDATYQVVGIGRLSDAFAEPLMVVGGNASALLRPGAFSLSWLGQVPGGATPEVVDALTAVAGTAVAAPGGRSGYWSYDDRGTRPDQLAWGWVGGVLALTVMGVIISAAFATSARRQLVTLGQLSANGADQRLLRRTLALQGAWSGALGSIVGVAAALAMVIGGRGLIERVIIRHSMGPLVISGFDLMVILVTGTTAAAVAAFVPARTITRVPVLAALGGRRPLGTVPRRLIPTGLGLFAFGVLLLFLIASGTASSGGSDGDLYAAVAVLGGLGVLFGMCCLTPAAVAVLGPIGERLGGVGRLAARSLARARTRSAAVVTAVAAAGALSMVGATIVASQWETSSESIAPWIARDTVVVDGYRWVEPTLSSESSDTPDASLDEPAPGLLPVTDEVKAELLSILPGSTLSALRYAVYDPAPARLDDGCCGPNRFLVADASIVKALGLTSADVAALDRGSLLTGDGPSFTTRDENSTSVVLRTQGGPISVELVPMSGQPLLPILSGNLIIGADTAQRIGLTVGESGLLVQADHDLTSDQRGAVSDLAQRQSDDRSNPFAAEVATPTSAENEVYNFLVWQPESWTPPRSLVDATIVVAALLFTLGVVAVGMALSAAESRDERDVLLAIGARPRAMRRVSAIKAALLAALGGVLAVPTGFVPVAVVLSEMDQPGERVVFPWLVAVGIVAAVPIVVGMCALIGSAVGQRIRPVRMSTLATD